MYSLLLHGRKSLELHKWLHSRGFAFSNSLSSASAAAAVSPLQDSRKGKNFTVSSYLVDSLGLTTKVADLISRKVSFEDKCNPESVLSLLRSNGFTDSQISSIITDYPRLLISDADKSLAPKLRFLQSRGASTSELTEVLSKVPKILVMKGDKTISRYYDFIKEVIEADKSSKFRTLCQSSLPQGSRQGNIIRNVSFLRELGVPQSLLFSLLVSNFKTVCGKDRFEDTIKKVVAMGFDPTTSRFVQALNVFYRLSDKAIEERVNLYKRLGFDVEDVWAVFKKWPNFLLHSEQNIVNSTETFLGLGFSRAEFGMMLMRFPQCIGLSAETVKKKTDVLVKQMDWPLQALVLVPTVYGLSMEKRIVPRCNVIKALLSKGLIGCELPPIRSVFLDNNEVFLKRYVRKHDDEEFVAELMAIFTKDIVS